MADDLRTASRLDALTAMGPVALTVRDLSGMAAFYERLLGLTRWRPMDGRSRWGPRPAGR